jgi:hypothetical protein
VGMVRCIHTAEGCIETAVTATHTHTHIHTHTRYEVVVTERESINKRRQIRRIVIVTF